MAAAAHPVHCLRRPGAAATLLQPLRLRYVATARAFVLAPQILGELAADHGRIADRFSLAYLLAMTSQVQADLVRVTELAAEQGKRVSTLSLTTRLRFESPEQRARFAQELQRAIVDVIGRFASPDKKDDGTPASGRPYRLVPGCSPAPPEEHRGPRPEETPQ